MPFVFPVQQELNAGRDASTQLFTLNALRIQQVSIDSFSRKLKDLQELALQEQQKVLEPVVDAMDTLGDAYNNLSDAIDTMADAQDRLTEEVGRINDVRQELSDRISETTDRLNEFIETGLRTDFHPMPNAGGIGAFQRLAVQDSYTGELRLIHGSTPPPGWFLCDGSWLDMVTEVSLFSMIGSKYGLDGNRFRLPRKQDLTADATVLANDMLQFIVRA